MDIVHAAPNEIQMADNYFSVLRNQVAEVWIDGGTEMGGGEPFTNGIEGEDRNWKYIVRRLISP